MLEGYYPWRAALPAAWEPRPGPPLGDVPMLVYPFLAFVRERLLDGQLPLWTASLNGGQPFLAAYQAAVFSPLTWTALLVPLPQATVAIALLRLLVGGVGLFVFVRGLGLSRGAAFVAGTAYLLNPFSVIWLEHPPGGVPPWLPWMLHAATRAAEGRRFGPAGLALATALVLLGGHPHTGLFCAAFGAAWAIAAAASTADRGLRVRRMAAVVAALALGAAVAAIQILPFVEYLFLSRGYTWRQFAGLNPLAAPASTLITALVPRFLGEHYADTYAGPLNYLEQTMYAGIPVLILAVVGSAVGAAAPRRDWRPIFFTATGVLATLAVYGAPGVLEVISALPLVKGATLTRIPIVAITSVIVAGRFRRRGAGGTGLGRRAPPRDDRRHRRRARHAAAVLAALTLQRSFLLRSMLSVETWRWSLWALLLAAGTGLALVAFARRHLERGPVVAALTALVALDLFVAGVGFHRLQPADRVYPAVAELTRLRGEPGPFRVVGAKGALMPNSALVYGLQDVRAYDGLGVAWYADLLDVALAWAQAHQQHELHAADSRVLDLLGVRYLLAPPGFAVDPAHWERIPDTTAPLYRNRREQPRAALVDGYVLATGDARRRLRDGAIDVRRDDHPRSGSRASRIVPSAPPPPTRSAPRASPRTSTNTSRSIPTRRDAACSCCPTRGSPAGARPSTAHPPRSRAPTSLSAPSPCRPAGIAWSSTTRRRHSGSVRRSPAWRCCSSRAGRRSPSAADGPCAPSACAPLPRSSRRMWSDVPSPSRFERAGILAQRREHAIAHRRVRGQHARQARRPIVDEVGMGQAAHRRDEGVGAAGQADRIGVGAQLAAARQSQADRLEHAVRGEPRRGEHREPGQRVGQARPRARERRRERPRARRAPRGHARASAAAPIVSGSATSRHAAARQTSPWTWCPISCATTTSISSSRSVSTSVSESRIWRVRPRPASAACACSVSSPPRHSRTARSTPRSPDERVEPGRQRRAAQRPQAAEGAEQQRRRHRPGEMGQVAGGGGGEPPGAAAPAPGRRHEQRRHRFRA